MPFFVRIGNEVYNFSTVTRVNRAVDADGRTFIEIRMIGGDRFCFFADDVSSGYAVLKRWMNAQKEMLMPEQEEVSDERT